MQGARPRTPASWSASAGPTDYAYDGLGRRIKKVVSNSGDLDGTELYYYGSVAASVLAGRSDWQVIEVRDGSENVVSQVVHGTRYIDEVVLQILNDGVAWVHQDANWNVLALTDFAGKVLERNHQTPYGVITVDQETYFGDSDGDGYVTEAEWDTNTNGQLDSGDDCWGSDPSGACRLVDFDFDGDVDAADATRLAELDSTTTYRRPGQAYSGIGNTRAHQGLIFDAEIGSYNNRARQYDPRLKRFMQRDPLARDASRVRWLLKPVIVENGERVRRLRRVWESSLYVALDSNPVNRDDWTGLYCGSSGSSSEACVGYVTASPIVGMPLAALEAAMGECSANVCITCDCPLCWIYDCRFQVEDKWWVLIAQVMGAYWYDVCVGCSGDPTCLPPIGP